LLSSSSAAARSATPRNLLRRSWAATCGG
jgi:hypothetical protein